jgi:threonine dehydrogenase-like Zn-dependent dehydrogenase
LLRDLLEAYHGRIAHGGRLNRTAEADYICYSEDDPVQRVQESTDGMGADVVIDASGSECALTQATRMVRLGGWITLIGLWGHDIRVNLDCVPYNNLTVRGGWEWAGIDSPDQAVRMALVWHSWETGLQIMAMGKIQLKPVITMRIPLEEWREGLERLEAKDEIEVMICPNKKYLDR